MIPDPREKSDALKEKGNVEFNAGRFGKAVACYTEAIELDQLNDICYSNRAEAFLRMDHNERALLDAEKAIELTKDGNSKAKYRKSRALFALEEYDEAKKEITEVIGRTQDANLLKCYNEFLERINQYIDNSKGIYKDSFYKDTQNGKRDFGNFISEKLEIRMSEGKGRGIFAKEDIEGGELILVEKTYFSKSEVISNKEGKMIKEAHIKELFEKLIKSKIDLLRTDHLLETSNPDFCDISVYRPGVYSRNHLKEKDQVLVHKDKSLNLLKHKSFEVLRANTGEYFSAIYFVSTIFNNSCAPTNNVENYALYDDMKIFQTKTFVKKGTELFFAYQAALKNYKLRQRNFLDMGFKCECGYCLYERETHYMDKIKECESQIRQNIKKAKIEKTISGFKKMNELMMNIDKRYFDSREMASVMLELLVLTLDCEELREIQRQFWFIWLNSLDYGSYYYQNLKYNLVLLCKDKELKEKFLNFLPIAEKNCSPFVKRLIDEKTALKLQEKFKNFVIQKEK